jgi:ribose transport system substrate-binding protein
MRSNWTCWLVALLTLSVLPSGCKKAEESKTEAKAKEKKEGDWRIAVIPKGTTHEFWKSVHFGAEKAAEELGNVEILWKGPLQENDRQGQINVMRDFVTQQVDGICLAPLDSSALIPSVEEAHEAGIPVVIFDSALDDETNIVTYVATDNYNGGKLAADQLVKAMGGKGDVVLLRYNQGSESTEERERGFLDTLKSDYPEVNILVDNEYAGTTLKESQDKAIQVLGKHKDEVDGVFAVCEPNAAGVLKALEELELTDKVKFVAFDPNAELVKGLETGSVHGIVLQDPVKMGYEAVMAMARALNKRIVTGEHVATPDNRSTDDMKRLLAPPKFDE